MVYRGTRREPREETGTKYRPVVSLGVAAITVALCSGCGASQPRFHYCYSLNGGSMRGLGVIDHRHGREDARQAAR